MTAEQQPADDARVFVPLVEAIAMLPEGRYVHTYRDGGMLLFGADYERDELIAAMVAAPHVELAGPGATSIHHGLVIRDDHGPLFIATKKP